MLNQAQLKKRIKKKEHWHLYDTTPVRMCWKSCNLTTERQDYKSNSLHRNTLDTLLYHVIPVLITNTPQNMPVKLTKKLDFLFNLDNIKGLTEGYFRHLTIVKHKTSLPFGWLGSRTFADSKAVFDLRADLQAPSFAHWFHTQKTASTQKLKMNCRKEIGQINLCVKLRNYPLPFE